ncbi:hypothetical protein ACW95P_04260 [Candidatus Mycoplasma pogonae]
MKKITNKKIIKKWLKKSSLFILTATPLAVASISFAAMFKYSNENKNEKYSLVFEKYNSVSEKLGPKSEEEIELTRKTLIGVINSLKKEVSEDADFVFSDANIKSSFNSTISQIEAKAHDKDFFATAKDEDFEKFLMQLKNIKNTWNGNANKAKALEKIKNLNNISQSAKDLVNNLKEINSKEKLENYVSGLQRLNGRLVEVKNKLKEYLDTMSSKKYLWASNKTQIDDEVKDATNKILDIDSMKIKISNVNEFNKALKKITEAKESLNGEEIFKTKKQKLLDKLKTQPLVFIEKSAINKITEKINEIESHKDFNDIETKINQAEAKGNELSNKINNLSTKKSEGRNFDLSDETIKNQLTNLINDLTNIRSSDLFNNENINLASTKLAEANKFELNGDTNFDNSKKQINGLTNLSEANKIQAINALEDTKKINSKSSLENAVQNFVAMDQKAQKIKNEISNLNNLSEEAQNQFSAELGHINITYLTLEEFKTKADKEVNKAKALNDKYLDLKSAYDKYKDEMAKANYLDATETVKTTQDAAVASALSSVLNSSIIPSLTTNLQGKFKANITANDVDTAIQLIKNALTQLDGNENLAKAKNILKNKVNKEGEFAIFSNSTKIVFNNKVDKADSIAKVNIVDNEAGKVLEKFNEIFKIIQKIDNEKNDINYKLSNDSKINAVNNVLNDLNNFKEANLFDTSLNTKLTEYENQTNQSLANLDGNQNFENVKTTIDSFENFSENQKTIAKTNIPTTSLADLNQYLDHLRKQNIALSKQKDIIDQLPKLSDELKNELKQSLNNIDITKTDDESANKDFDFALKNAIELNAKYKDFQNAVENYISMRETAVYGASTNQKEQDKIALDAVNIVLNNFVNDFYINFSANTFKYGIDISKVNNVMQIVKTAIKNLDGEFHIEAAKNKLIEKFKNNSNLSITTKNYLEMEIKKVNSNQHDWKQKLNELEHYTNSALMRN